MKIKKILLNSSLIFSNLFFVSFTISCGTTSSDFKTMSWSFDIDKIKKESADYETFNNEMISITKLEKIVKTSTTFEFDRYTVQAMGDNWFEQISFELNSNNQPYKLVIKLKEFQVVNINNSNINKQCPYRLPNNNLIWEITF